ncbi:MAG: Hpt domain-containing protein, partial [Verrucomicrobiota bacterium]
MSDEPSPELQRELLDDFYTECDELFGQIRAQLEPLERVGADLASPATHAALETLFRCVHSIKGNCGIVGLRSAEQLSHAAEDVLRRFTRRHGTPTPASLELVAHSIHRLEQLVSAHRHGQTPPEIEDLVASLRRTADAAAPASEAPSAPPFLSAPPFSPRPAPSATGAQRYLATFAPSKDLDARGVNISSVRTR